MNERRIPPARELKMQARQTIATWAGPCLAVTALLVALQVGIYLFRYYGGGILSGYLLDITEYGATRSGIWLAEGGINIFVRLDAVGLIFALPLGKGAIMSFFVVNLVCFLLLTPLRFGALEQYHAILNGQPRPFRALFHWYTDLRHTGKALLLALVLGAMKWGTRIIFCLPGYVAAYVSLSDTSLAPGTLSALSLLGLLACVAGLLVSYVLYLIFFFRPAIY